MGKGASDMASPTEFEDFAEQLGLAKHDLNAHALHLLLTNNAPSASADAVLADLAQIANGNGYTTDGIDTTNSYSESGGTGTLVCTDVQWVASGTMATFRYPYLVNITQTSPLKPLIMYWDYGSAIALADSETFDGDFGASAMTVN